MWHFTTAWTQCTGTSLILQNFYSWSSCCFPFTLSPFRLSCCGQKLCPFSLSGDSIYLNYLAESLVNESQWMACLGGLILWGCPRRARSGNTSFVFVDDYKDHKPIMCERVLREDACECVNYFLDLSSGTCPHFQITKKGVLALCSLRGCQGLSQENVTGISLQDNW